MTAINLDVLARFALLPGAAELMQAFSVIPPGPLRDSVIHHAQVIAQEYAGTPPQHRAPPPQALAPTSPAAKPVKGKPPALALVGQRTPPVGDDPHLKIVQMRLEGFTIPQIMAEVGLGRSAVFRTLAAARKAGAPVPQQSPREDLQAQVVKLRKKNWTQAAIAKQLSCSKSHVETLLREARAAGEDLSPKGRKAWPTKPETAGKQAMAALRRAAEARGISVDAYVARQQQALDLALKGAGYERILRETGETDVKIVSVWMANARAAGHPVLFMTAADRPLEGEVIQLEEARQA